MAFLALIKSINPDLVNLRESLSKEPKENLRQAFMLAHQCLDVPPLLEPEGKNQNEDVIISHDGYHSNMKNSLFFSLQTWRAPRRTSSPS